MTRSLLFTLCLFLATAATVNAQAVQGDLRFGFQLSPTFSSMNTDNNQINGDGTNLGLKLGLMSEFYFRDNYSFSTGLNFHLNAGGTLFYEDTFEDVNIWDEAVDDALPDMDTMNFAGQTSFKYNLQYVEIPLALTLRTREFGYLRYFVRPGFNLGILTQSRGNVKGDDRLDDEEEFDIGSATNALNLSWGISAGIEYSVSANTALIGGIGFQSGFADITKDNGTSVTRSGRSPEEDDSRGKLNSVVITLGVLF